ncbi:peptide deformylase [Lacticaseibacillus jixianensis]|uniref:Peptide deformylase n=1 Tax=Lacticaseibacillus jixianensis TaxID=2486012 RepID=A0ABW4B8Z4_9LACO|nr:peptide deformylase [Lacticaseibacillus jixianensis]
MIRPIEKDQLFLQQKAALATPADRQVIQDLQDTLAANATRCVGMAANMIGVLKRIIIVQMGPLPVVMVNPQITKASGQYQTTEGCLSLDGERPAKRYDHITVRYQDAQFRPHTQQFTGFVAQIIQHELAHCDGVLI